MYRSRIFCVDDDLITLGFLGDVLGEFYDVGLCSTAAVSIQRASAFQPDLILLDYSMPGLSGVALLSTFKAHADLHSTPVVVFTAYSDSADINALMATGVRGLIEKPVSPEQLHQQVAYVLEHPEFV